MKKLDGITKPQTYAGEFGTYTACHCEDAEFCSANFLIEGLKVWLVIERGQMNQVEEAFFREIKAATENSSPGMDKICPNTLLHKEHLITSDWLDAQNIRYHVILQRENDLVLTAEDGDYYLIGISYNS